MILARWTHYVFMKVISNSISLHTSDYICLGGALFEVSGILFLVSWGLHQSFLLSQESESSSLFVREVGRLHRRRNTVPCRVLWLCRISNIPGVLCVHVRTTSDSRRLDWTHCIGDLRAKNVQQLFSLNCTSTSRSASTRKMKPRSLEISMICSFRSQDS